MSRFIVSALAVLSLGTAASGQMTFSSAVNYRVGQGPEGGILFDFNHDYRLDIVVTTEQPDKLEFLQNQGNGTFVPAFTLLTGNGTSPEGLAFGDFDGDQDVDLITALFSSNQVQLIFNDGTGHFTLGPTFSVGTEPSIIVAADFNSDGFPDAAVNNRSSGDVSVLLNNQTGGFQPAVSYAVGVQTRCVAAGDFNNDNLPDLAVSARDSLRVRLFRNIGGGAFVTLVDLSLGTTLKPEGVALADFDHDGKLDVVTATAGTAAQQLVSVFLQENGGHPWVGPINGNTGGNSPMGIVTGDFDRDGRVDCAAANADSNTVSLKKNGGIGIFFAPVLVAVGQNPQALVMAGGDLDSNGSDDLVTFNRDSNNVSVLMNLTSVPAVGDINADGSVNIDDLVQVITHWGGCPQPCPPFCAGDATHDCTVNIDDIVAVITHWG